MLFRSTSNFVEFSFTASSSTGVVYTIPAQTITLGCYTSSAAGTTTAQLTLATSDVIVAGTKYRTVYGTNVGGTYSPYTDTSVTLTA